MKFRPPQFQQRVLSLFLSWIGITLLLGHWFEFSVYVQHTFASHGAIAAWKQRSKFYKYGWVVRVLWFGMNLRFIADNTVKYDPQKVQ